MSQIKGKDTKIEKEFRKHIWNKGIRGYRIKNKISGRPDLYFPSKKIAVFIDGCFWHKCPKCFIKPKSNISFWNNKINNNVKKDLEINKLLKKQDIKVIRFWEHEVKKELHKCFKKMEKYYEKH